LTKKLTESCLKGGRQALIQLYHFSLPQILKDEKMIKLKNVKTLIYLI